MKTNNRRFKQWKSLRTPQSKALFVQPCNLCSETINSAKTSFGNRINHKIASCQTGSYCFWSLAKVISQNFCCSSFPPLKNNSGSSSCTPLSKANLFGSIFTSNYNLDDEESQPPLCPSSTITMPPVNFSTRKVRKTLLQLNTSKSKGPDGIPAIVLKTCSLNSHLFSTNSFSLPTLSVYFHLLGSLPTFSLSPRRGEVLPLELSPNCNHFTHL